MRSRFFCAIAIQDVRFRLGRAAGVTVLVAVLGLVAAGGVQAKDKVDLLVTHGTVVTMDEQRRLIQDGAVAVRGDSIVAVGPSTDIAAQYEATKTVDAHGAIVMPGLINGHAHVDMSLFRGMADDL